MWTLWKHGYVPACKEPAETALALGGRVIPPTTIKEPLGYNRVNYLKIVQKDALEKRHKECGCLAKSDGVQISCVDDIFASNCRSEGYRANMKLLGDAKEKSLGITKGVTTHSGVKTIAFTHAVLGSWLSWMEQLKQRCESIAASYIRHEDANMFFIKAIANMEDIMKETKEAVCQVQALLDYTSTQQELEKNELEKGLPLVFLHYP